MTRRQNHKYRIASQQKLNYIPKSAQIKLELSLEKGTKEGEDFQALQEKHSQLLADCQLKLKSVVIKAGDLNLVKKNKLAIVSFVELIHAISEGFLTYDDHQDINAHECLVDVIELYSDHIAVKLNALEERPLKEYKKIYELEEMPIARVICPQATDTSSVPPNAQPSLSENFRERTHQIFNERAAAAALRNNTTMDVYRIPATRKQPPQPDACIYATLYTKLKTALEVIFVLGWGESYSSINSTS